MKIFICDDYEDLSKKAYASLKQDLMKKPNLVLGLATGSSPEGLYKEMIKDGMSYKDVTTYNLDEYVGIDKEDPQSYHTFMNEHLFNHIDIKKENTHVPYGSSQVDADAYEKSLGDIDVQILGIGQNGHIGFNEPGTPFNQTTSIVDLTQDTIQANSRFFDSLDDVPTQAISMGIASIMKAKKIILIASGKNKAKAIHEMIHGPITENCPAAILQKHNHVEVYVDKDASSI